ncbi:MAG: ABC transporter permease, partial [Rhodospirillaceae bacterium]
MKYFPLIWAGLWRKRTRTVFTILSIMVAFLLFGMLQGVNSAFSNATKGANLNRLYVMNKFSFVEALPLAHLALIKTVPGVTGVTHMQWFGGYYQDQKNQVVSWAVDPASYFKIFPEIHVPKDQLDALLNMRTGAIIGRKLAEKYNWKIGDEIPITSAIWVKKSDQTSNWTFNVVGIFDDPENSARANTLIFNYDYFDEARTFANGTVGWFVITIDDPTHAAQIGAGVDALFANSPNETHTQTEKENM